MGFDRRQDSGARSGGHSGGFAPQPGKQTLVASELEAAESDAPTPGKQTLVNAELEAFTLGAGPIQRKAPVAGAAAGGPPPVAGGGTPLPPDVRARMEAALGGNFSAVRIHQDVYAQAIGAQAFTRGSEIFFAPGRFDPGSPQGLALIGHELAHVKQQADGRVPVTAQIGGAPANNDPGEP